MDTITFSTMMQIEFIKWKIVIILVYFWHNEEKIKGSAKENYQAISRVSRVLCQKQSRPCDWRRLYVLRQDICCCDDGCRAFF